MLPRLIAKLLETARNAGWAERFQCDDASGRQTDILKKTRVNLCAYTLVDCTSETCSHNFLYEVPSKAYIFIPALFN
jgi:hypothetical protein